MSSAEKIELKLSPSPVASLVRSSCAYCGVGCGVDILRDKNQAISLTGSVDHPANFGRLCVKGTHLLDTIDLDNRLLAPEINGKTVDWDSAIDAVASGFNDIIRQHGPDAVAFYVSGQLLTEDYYVANKLMKGYIGSANIDTNSRLCMSSAVASYKRAFGEDLVPCSYTDVEQTDLMVLVGSNAAWTHPVLFQRMERAKLINANYRVVVIDPRQTATSDSADMHLAIKPGSDAALFNGLLNFIAQNNATDSQFIANHTQGFVAALTEASSWTIEKVAKYCGIETSALLSFYQLFANSNKAVTLYSMGINQSTSGVDKGNSIINVHLATGKIGKIGCGPFSMTGQPNAMGGREVGGLANQLAAHLDIENPQHRSLVQTFWQSPTMATKAGAKAIEMFDQIDAGKIKAVWIMATNPMVSLPDSQKIKRALAKCDLVVVSDCVANNDTLVLADIKLPATGWLEKNGTVTNSERRISRQRNVVEPAGLAKHDWQIISMVGQKMGFDGFNYQHPAEIFCEHALLSGKENHGENRRLFDISAFAKLSLKEYDNLQPVQWPVNQQHPQGCNQLFADGRFSTDSGKAQFIAIEPKQPEQQTSDTYPFALNTGRIRDQWHTMTRTGKAATLSQHTAKPYLWINPADADKLGLADDQLITVASHIGEIQVPVQRRNQIKEKQLFLPIHWNEQFASNACVSQLFPGAVDPISGQPESKHLGVEITPYPATVFAEIYLNQDLVPDSDYWLKSKLSKSYYFQLAALDKNTLSTETIKQWTQLKGEWIGFADPQTGQHNLLCLQSGKLAAVVYLGNKAPTEAANWINDLFDDEPTNINNIKALIYQITPEAAQASKKVCSCFNVSQGDIVNAIQTGCHSVTALGKKLGCGTNCGSCKPELQGLINQHLEDSLFTEA